MLNKNEIRKSMIDKRDKLSLDEKSKWDKTILERLIDSEYYKKAKVIFAYVSYKSEIDTHSFIEYAIKDKKIICVPKVISKEKGMKALIINSLSDLKKGAYGILEPSDSAVEIDENDIDLVLVPGTAFDGHGGRMGYGGGFYDRFLKKTRYDTLKVGMAYKFQIIEKVPMDEFDVRINGIISNG